MVLRWENRYRASTKVGTWFGSGLTDPVYDFVSISTVTVGAGGTATVTFSSIPTTYTHLQIRGLVKANAGYELRMQLNGDTGSNYSTHNVMGDSNNVYSSAGTSFTYMRQFVYTGLPTNANTFGAFVMDILDYKNTNKYKTVRSFYGQDSNGVGEIGMQSGAWFNTSAVSSVSFYTSGTISQYSDFALYGITG